MSKQPSAPPDDASKDEFSKIKPLQMPTPEQIMQQDMMDNCAVKCIMSGAMGSMLGVAFGLFTASLDAGGLDTFPGGVETTKTTRQILKETFQTMRQRSWSYAKNFGYLGLLYSGSECVIEKYRAKHDKYNAMYAGCVTGGLLATQGGWKAMCMGCAGFAAFSVAIEHFRNGM